MKKTIFILSLIAIGALGLFAVMGFSLPLSPQKPLIVVSSNAYGLTADSVIKRGGIRIGKVTSVNFGAKGVVIKGEIDPDFILYADTTARLETAGIVGDTFIELSVGTPKAGLLPEGNPLVLNEPTDFSGFTEEERKRWLEAFEAFVEEVKKANQ